MLIKLTDTDGKDFWINPLYVKAVMPGKGGTTKVFIRFGTTFNNYEQLKVSGDPQAIADLINAGMPEAPAILAAAGITDEQDEEARQQAAAIAAAG